MWEWDWFLCPISSSTFHKKPLDPQKNLLPIQLPCDQNDDVPCCCPSVLPSDSLKMILASLLSNTNTSSQVNVYVKYFFLALFSPLLLPLFFAFFPFVCALEIFLRLCRRRWRRKRRRRRSTAANDGCGGGAAATGNEEIGNGQRLLQRYLEDQLILVVGSLYDQCGDEHEEEEEITGANEEYFESKSPSLMPGKN